MTESMQPKLPTIDDFFLSQRLEESRALVKKVVEKADKPLIIQFSGGKDSMALIGLVREITDKFLCCYMITGIEFPKAIEFAGNMARELGVGILFTDPSVYKGGFFDRLAKFKRFPGIPPNFPWCVRDLKLRPQRIVLETNFGKGTFYKLNGVRKYESYRRRYIYDDNTFIQPDYEHRGSYMVFPLLRWTDDDVLNYLKMAGLPTSELYKQYGVSGCYWCPFYQADIYRTILLHLPNLYDEFIEWEEKLGQPSVIGQIYLRDLKKEVINGLKIDKNGEL